MSDPLFEIGAPGMDAGQIVQRIREDVRRKREAGVYADARVARAERANLVHLSEDDETVDYYLDCLREAVAVDITDFEIHERRRFCSRLLVGLKRGIWNLLKFYTYRLWAQQNQVNAALLSALEGLEKRYRSKVQALEERLAALENRPDAR